MRIAILGAGFSGLAVAWNLSIQSNHQITVFDPLQIGQGTSGIAAGLLHGYAGAHAKLNRRAHAGLHETIQLLKIAENFLGFSVAKKTGMLRPAMTSEQIVDFERTTLAYNDVHWKSVEECQSIIPNFYPYPCLFIENCYVVDSLNYLNGLNLACKSHRVQFEQHLITSLKELAYFDCVVLATGAYPLSIHELPSLPISVVKGQVLEFVWPDHISPIPLPINSHAYLVMSLTGQSCIAGSTFERDYHSFLPDIEVAKREIMPKLAACLKGFDQLKILDCRAGLRAVTPSHLPIIGRHHENCWKITGMGSKGLLYHALYAKELAAMITQQN